MILLDELIRISGENLVFRNRLRFPYQAPELDDGAIMLQDPFPCLEFVENLPDLQREYDMSDLRDEEQWEELHTGLEIPEDEEIDDLVLRSVEACEILELLVLSLRSGSEMRDD